MSKRSTANIPSKKVVPPKRLVVMNPNKGLNNYVSPTLIDNKEFSDLQNVEYDEGGVIRKRSGYTQVGDALTAAKGLGAYTTELTQQMVTIDNGTLKYRTVGSWSSAAGAVFTASADPVFVQARLKLFIWNGVDAGAYFDGTTVTRPGTMPRAKFSVFYQSKHIAAGVPGQPSRLYISNLSDATDFTVATGGTQPQPDSTNDAENGNPNVPGATVFSGTPALTEANVIDIRKNDGDKITGLGVFQDVLIVFKERAIYQVTFDSSGNPTVTPITYATGCVAHRSIKAVENDLYFLSREGLRVLGNEPQYFTAIRTNVLSIRIQPTMDSISKAYYERCNAEYFDNKYIMGFPTGTTSGISRSLAYDRRFAAFVVWTLNPQALLRFTSSADNSEALYFINQTGTRLYMVQPGTYNDNGTAIEAYVVGKAQDGGQPDLMKFWVDLRLIFRRLNGVLTLTIYDDTSAAQGTTSIGSGSDRGAGLNVMGTFQLGTDGESSAVTTGSISDSPVSVSLNLNSRNLKYKIYNNNLNENFVLLGTVYAFYPKSHFVFDSSQKIYI